MWESSSTRKSALLCYYYDELNVKTKLNQIGLP
jgi:hypothetical protein